MELSSTNPKFTLGLAMIVKDEVDELVHLFKSFEVNQGPPLFDDIVVAWNGSNPKTKEILEQFGARVIPYTWKDDFADARNFSFSQSLAEYVMWIDADDQLIGACELRSTLINAFSKPGVTVVEMPYHYDHDEEGNVVMILWSARVVKKGTFIWKGAIHECLIPTQDFVKCRVENVYVKHSVNPERVKNSAERNLRISKREYEKEHEKGNIDPRTTLYYAKALYAKGFIQEAVPIFEEYLEQSEWDDERYQVLCILADIHTSARQYHKGIEYARRALTLRPLYGQAYFELAEIFYRMEKWEECIHFIDIGLRSKCPMDLVPVDPMEYKWRPLVMLEFALFQLGKPEESLRVIEQALKFKPRNKHLLDRRKSVLGFIARLELENSALRLCEWLSKNGEKDKLQPFCQALPEVVRDHPTFVRLQSQFNKRKGKRNRIVIYCGPTFETWDPNTAKEHGLGGSEEAVVYLSQKLCKLGWVVDVYNNCERPGVWEGVSYNHFWTYNQEDPCDIFIAWRNSEYVMLAPEGSRAFIWLHDRQKMEYWSPERISRVEKIFVLSNYHRKDLLDIPDEKFFITRNGIVPSHFAARKNISRDPLKCFYASSPDRGLDVLLELWPQIHKEVPNAHCHVFYGFSKTYDLLHKDHDNMMRFKENILAALKQDGISYHGRVNHPILHEHMMSSGLWLYPTHFTEISCITAMKAQAAGAIPVTMTLAALDETVQYGYKIAFGIEDQRSRKAFVNITIDLLKHPEKQERIRPSMMEWAIKHFDWEEVAKQWDELFRSAPVKSSLV